MITLHDFYMGRDLTYGKELTEQIAKNAEDTVFKVNRLLGQFYAANPGAKERTVSSGWRPAAINANTKGAAKKSNHMVGNACDLHDEDGRLDMWCMSPAGQKAMADICLWLEHPSATPGWCHVQRVPPGSGNRVFYP